MSEPLPQLIKRALARSLIRSPSQQFRAVPEPVVRHMVKAHFNDQFRSKRFPGSTSFRAPAARSSGCIAGETGRFSKSFQTARQLRTGVIRNRRGKADMVELALKAVEAEQ